MEITPYRELFPCLYDYDVRELLYLPADDTEDIPEEEEVLVFTPTPAKRGRKPRYYIQGRRKVKCESVPFPPRRTLSSRDQKENIFALLEDNLLDAFM